MKKWIGVVLAVLTLSGCINYAEGDRYGNIYKISQKGLVFKTWECEMMLSGVQSGQSWAFSIRNDKNKEDQKDIVDQLQFAADANIPVRVHYKQDLIPMPWNGGTAYYVQSVSQTGDSKLK